MASNAFIAFFAGLGAAIWVYNKFSKRASGGEFVKNLTPALFAGLFTFVLAMMLLSQFA